MSTVFLYHERNLVLTKGGRLIVWIIINIYYILAKARGYSNMQARSPQPQEEVAYSGAVGNKVLKGKMTYVVAELQVEIFVQMRSDNP